MSSRVYGCHFHDSWPPNLPKSHPECLQKQAFRTCATKVQARTQTNDPKECPSSAPTLPLDPKSHQKCILGAQKVQGGTLKAPGVPTQTKNTQQVSHIDSNHQNV